MTEQAIETEVVKGPNGEEIAVPVINYRAKVEIEFTIRAPLAENEAQLNILEQAIWQAMPAGNIGPNMFVQMPYGASDFQVSVKAAPADEQAEGVEELVEALTEEPSIEEEQPVVEEVQA